MLEGYRGLVEDLRILMGLAVEDGEAEAFLDVDLLEDVEAHRCSTIYHVEVPKLLRELLEGAGAEVRRVYHLKEDRPMPEYIVECRFDSTDVEVWLDIDIDRECGSVVLRCAYAFRGLSPDYAYKPYYHEV